MFGRRKRKNRVKLPTLKEFKVVCFHRRAKKTHNRIVLQIPNEEYSDSSTYYLDLNSAEDTDYLIRQNEGLFLLDQIRMHDHVAYVPAEGECRILEDRNEQTTASRFHAAYALADRKHKATAQRQIARLRKVSALRRKKQKQPHVP